MKRMMIGVAMALGLALLGAPQVQAQPSLDFNTASPASGTIAYATAGGDLTGTNITVGTVSGINGTPANNGVSLPISGGLLNFTTGAYTGGGSSEWDFGAGTASPPSITIAGGVAGTSPPLGSGTILLTGQVLGARVVPISGGEQVNLMTFNDTVNATLASFYGLPGGPSSPWTGAMNLSFFIPSGVTPGQANTFTSTGIGSGDTTTHPIPEPSTLAIAGLGALGFIGYGLRRRLKK
jgi:hypothetical protein